MLKTDQAQKWLTQFDIGDRAIAEQLLAATVLVSRDQFHDQLRELILANAKEIDGSVALYAERELRHRHGVPHRLFKESSRLPRRAEGSAGPSPVMATKAYDPSVGSEGLVANLITELCREFRGKFLNHPGPDQIRKQRARAFWVVTDFVGSGQRARNYLQAAWMVRSVRSWWSGHFMRPSVVAYASTDAGEKWVRSHPSKPQLLQVTPCPTVQTSFPVSLAEKVVNLCEAYNPASGTGSPFGSGMPALGYAGGGALIVFAHGAPNNVPTILHKASSRKTRPWTPLFPARVSAGLPAQVFGQSLSAEEIAQRLSKRGQTALARSAVALGASVRQGEVLMLLGALSHPPRMNDSVLSGRSGLPTYRVAALCRVLISHGWLDSQRRLTDSGRGQVKHFRKKANAILRGMFRPSGLPQYWPYYPKSLRQPV